MSQPVTECASCGFKTPQLDSPDGDRTAPKFCGSCGARLADDTAQTPHATALPSSLSDAHKRPIIVLMADVSGYSGLSETLELDWLYEVLREVLAQLSECVLEHGGHIDKYVGDEVVALFGYPRAIEDGADRALHAALAMHKRMADLNRTNVHLVGKVLELHIGINAGVVMSGPVGSGESEGTTVIGDVVNVAKRLESAAPAGSTYLSQSVVDRLRGRYS
ncbi:MAG: hypothetical protein GF320_16520, partial [Armatimonadia bacterium]|nr:hypothetical protein [Armatimonadia bacterium]